MRFKTHYTRDQAQALLPQIRQWLEKLGALRSEVEKYDKRLASAMASGNELGGELVNSWVRGLAAFQSLLAEFYQREIQIKDLDRGLIDFPAIVGGKEVFLCWESGEDSVEFWHELEDGYAGRKRL